MNLLPFHNPTYEDPSTGLEMLFDLKTKSTLIRFRGMTAEISHRKMRDMVRGYYRQFTKKQLIQTDPYQLYEWFTEELIAQCVYDWINSKG